MTMAVRVLLLSPLPPPCGGISLWTQRLIAECANRAELDLRVIDTGPSFRPTVTASFARRLTEGLLRLPWELLRVVAAIVCSKPDVIHLNTSGSLATFRDLVILTLSRASGIPVAVHVRFGRVPDLEAHGGWEWRLMRRVLRLADLVIAVDQSTLNVADRQHSPTLLLPNFVSVLEQPEVGARRRVFLFAGWVTEAKGALDLLEAWEESKIPGWALQIVGKVGNEPSVLDRLADADGTVEVLGEVDRDTVMRLMCESSCLVLPSHSEGFPNVVAEAMSSGTPVIATSVGAVSSMLCDGAGLVVAPHDPMALASAMSRIASDESLRLTLGRRAWKKCHDEYRTEVVISQLVDAWCGLAGEKMSPHAA